MTYFRSCTAAAGIVSLLAGCATTANTPDAPVLPRPEPVFRIEDQREAVVYVPTMQYSKPGAPINNARDTYAYVPTLDLCKAALDRAAPKRTTGSFAGYAITEKACYEVRREGGQKKIVVN